jgi:VanZ family protein
MSLTFQRPVAVWLFVLTVAGILYGSLYPFDFRWTAIPVDEALGELMGDGLTDWGKGNVLANIVLFVPYGLFGAVMLAKHRAAWLRWSMLLGGGALLAFGLQVLQLWLPQRVPDFGDGVLNMVGLTLGAALARLPWARFSVRPSMLADGMLALPVLLMGCWVAYKWAPFVPTADWYLIKQGLKPLLLEPRLEPLSVYRNLVCWLVFASLWRDCRLTEGWLWVVIPGVVLAQVGIAHNALALDGVIGAALAPAVWMMLRRVTDRPEAPMMFLLLALVVVQGLSPFVWAASPFHWLPFRGFLTGSMFVNLLSLLFKLYLYGSLVWLVFRATRVLWAALLFPVGVTALVEIAQTQIAGRVAEITDPLLCVMIWSVLWISGRRRSVALTGRDRTGLPKYVS